MTDFYVYFLVVMYFRILIAMWRCLDIFDFKLLHTVVCCRVSMQHLRDPMLRCVQECNQDYAKGEA